jgi:DNA polymerase III subunit epsilon
LLQKQIAQQTAELFQSGFIVIDLETTGFPNTPNVEIVEIAALNNRGETLLDTLIKPRWRIPAGASQVHGIYDHHVVDAPPFDDMYVKLTTILSAQTAVAYNSPFEEGIIASVCRSYGLPAPRPAKWHCSMRAYQKYCGSHSFLKLAVACMREEVEVANAHRAMGDCLMTLALMQRMAAAV